MSGKNSKVFFSLAVHAIAAFIFLYGANVILEYFFIHDGEAYYKGAGHLLKEKFSLAILFITLRNFLLSLIISSVLFHFIGISEIKLALKVFTIIWAMIIIIVLIYIGSHLPIPDNSSERYIEIGVVWFVRTAGFFTGYYFYKKNVYPHLV